MSKLLSAAELAIETEDYLLLKCVFVIELVIVAVRFVHLRAAISMICK